MIRITIACPESHIEDANQLARCIGYSEADGKTYGEARYSDAKGNKYSVASGIVSTNFVEDAVAELKEPEWGADMEAAGRAQGLIMIGGEANPDQITAVINDDPQTALDEMGLTLKIV